MNQENLKDESESNWHEELNELIQEKKTENIILKKVSESVFNREPTEQALPERPEEA